jgi:hypothetical protein
MANETAEQRRAARIRAEVAEFEADPRMRAQAVIDAWWERKLLAEAPLDDGYVDIGGFRELRRPTCHRGPRDSDWSLR